MGGAKWVRWHLFSCCFPFCGSNLAESLPLQGVLRDMRPQLLPEGNSHLSPPFIGGQVFPSFYVLLLGRILSGVSTSCLYSVFEVNLKKQLTESRRFTFDKLRDETKATFSELVCGRTQSSRITQRNTFINPCTGSLIKPVSKKLKCLIKYTQVTTCNSLLAIFAGLLSDLLVRGFSLGPLAPFLAALVTFL